MSSKEEKIKSPIAKTSAEPAPVKFVPDESLARLNLTETIKVCGNCKLQTKTLWANVGVVELTPNADALETLKLTRRVSLCTNCGVIKATT